MVAVERQPRTPTAESPLKNGEELNQYRIIEKLGEGGMGQVFRAEDTRLKRDVAIKVLPPDVAGDPERIARMEREAQVLASLEHPNIAAIYGIEQAEVNGTQVRFLAMQLAEGSTLADRIAEGPVLLGEALQIALQIAEGLEAAHEKGVVHRDLKPANIQIGTDGTVKLLDFGLAKAVDGRNVTTGMDLTASPTVLEATRQGVIMGTAGYMSPEQARGYTVDQRTDIWAFGAVLYEMLAGRTVFAGETATDVLGAIVHREPDWKLLPAVTPRRIQMLIKRCLRKDAKRRLQAIGDARVTILDFLEDPVAAEASVGREPIPAWQRWLPWGVAAVLALALAGSILVSGRADEPAAPLRTQTVLDTSGLMFLQAGTNVAVSPGGDHIVVAQGDVAGADLQLWSRSLDDPTFTVLAPAVAYAPFFSPDGEWVGFVSPSALQKVPVTGGTPLVLCEVSRARGATWGVGGTIVFAGSPNSGLSVVSQEGGAPEVLTTLDEEAGEATHRWPHFLPDGVHVLFTTLSTSSDFDRATLEIINIETGARKVVHRGGSYGRYLPTGHILYYNAGTLFAMPFDLATLEATGGAVPVVNDVEGATFGGNAQFDISNNGLLVYRQSERRDVPLHVAQWVNRDGEGSMLWDDPDTYAEPRISPDGTKAVFMVLAGRNWDLWTYDIERDVSTRLTFDAGFDGPAVWSPDGEEVIFSSDINGASNLYRRRADGSGEIQRITESADTTQYVSDWSNDGRYVLITAEGSVGGAAITYLDLEEGGDETSEFLPPTGVGLAEAMFSPNGRWVAYQSRESGQNEVYVRPFPPAGGKWQVSDAGGSYPKWSADGRELYYRNDEGIVVVSVGTEGSSFTAGRAQQLFRGAYRGGIQGVNLDGIQFAHYDVAPDGRFVMFPAPPTEETPNVEWLQVVANWFTELNRRVPTGS